MNSNEHAPVGMAHPTVVPTNFEPEPERCPECGRPADDDGDERSED